MRRRIEPAVGEIAARLRPDWIVQGRLEDLRGERQHVMQGGAPLVSRLAFGGAPRHRQPGHPGEPLDRLGKAEAFDIDQERKDVAALAGREIVIKLLLVIDEKRGRALLVERREPTPFAPCLFELDARAHDLGQGDPGADFVEEFSRKLHSRPDIGFAPPFDKCEAGFSPVSTAGASLCGRPHQFASLLRRHRFAERDSLCELTTHLREFDRVRFASPRHRRSRPSRGRAPSRRPSEG